MNNFLLSENNNLSDPWLKNGLVALGIAGLYSIVLVLLRTPQLTQFFYNKELFRASLVIHVNLSILVWLISIVAVVMSNQSFFITNMVFSRLALLSSVIIGISPFTGEISPVMNNYIPMLENIVFAIGMGLFASSILLFVITIILKFLFDRNWKKISELYYFAGLSSAILLIATFVCFVFSYFGLQRILQIVPMEIEYYYELLFWSGGHLLQFIYTQILMLVWVILLEKFLDKKSNFQKVYLVLLIAHFIFAFCGIFGHLFYDIVSSDFKEFYTKQMYYFGGLCPTINFAIVLYEIFKERRCNLSSNYAGVTLICSSGLFFFGGIIGILISGVNVTIPAHYHGSIVGISIGFMGFAYSFVDFRLSFAKLQLWLISAGQMLHIGGLTYAGGYGVLRKTPGTEMLLSAKIAMGLMGIGGLIAIIGGLMFVLICGRGLFFNNGAKTIV